MSGQTTVSASVARPIRGAGQNGLAYGIVSWLATRYHFTPEQFGLAVLALGAVVTYVHNFLEDRGIIPALLKAESTADPVPVVDATVSDEASKAVTKAKKEGAAKRKKDAGLTAVGVVCIVLIVIAALALGLGTGHPLFLLLLLLILVVLVV